MKAMKTVEEKRKSVLAECETICPNIGDFSRVRLLGIGKIERTSEVGFDPHYDGKIWAIFAHGGGKILYFLHEDSDEAIIEFAYMLFGFSERDAVAEKEREWAKDIETIHDAHVELLAKNAALVTLLTTMKDNADQNDSDDATFRQWVFDAASYRLEANEKGGKGE